MMSAVKSNGNSIRLPARLNAAAAHEVLEMVKSNQGNALVIDASDVSMMGTQCLQVLVAAQRAWQAEGKDFRVSNLSDEMSQAFGILGLTAEQIGAGEVKNGA